MAIGLEGAVAQSKALLRPVVRLVRAARKLLRHGVRRMAGAVADSLIYTGSLLDLGIVFNPSFGSVLFARDKLAAVTATNRPEASQKQWDLIAPAMLSRPGVVLDIGARKCFHTIKAAERARHVFAVEYDARICRDAGNLLYRLNIRNVFVLNFSFDEDTAHLLPQADTVFFLSVYHQWVVERGPGKAFDLLGLLWAKADREMFFSMADGLHSSVRYAPHLTFLGKTREEKLAGIAGLLGQLPEANVRHLGAVPYWDREVRHVFKLERRP